jgi:hypothetical protein
MRTPCTKVINYVLKLGALDAGGLDALQHGDRGALSVM